MFDPDSVMKVVCLFALALAISYVGLRLGWRWFLRACKRNPDKYKFKITFTGEDEE